MAFSSLEYLRTTRVTYYGARSRRKSDVVESLDPPLEPRRPVGRLRASHWSQRPIAPIRTETKELKTQAVDGFTFKCYGADVTTSGDKFLICDGP